MTESLSTLDLKALFAADGPLSQHINHYAPRDNQIAMAQAVEQAIDRHSAVLIEAGTGIGKTFAYLVPAILSGKRVIVSTGTKNLQDQLYQKDIPLLKKIIPSHVALLKGRANYLCLYRMKQSAAEGQFAQKQSIADLQKIIKWSTQTKVGDKAEVLNVAEDAAIWPHVTSTGDNCLGQECPFINDCHLVKARRQAMQAKIVIVNHHLFFADSVLKSDQLGELLPEAEVVIIDEAHQLPETATMYFSTTFSSKQLLDLCGDIEREYVQSTKDVAETQSLIAKLRNSVNDVRARFPLSAERSEWLPMRQQSSMHDALERLQEALQIAVNFLQALAERSEGLQQCVERALALKALLAVFIEVDCNKSIYWYETFSKSFRLFMSPITIGEQFTAIMQREQAAWIFTSATLTTNNQFDYFQSQLNLQNINYLQFNGPFSYQQQALAYLPRYMPLPADKQHTEKFMRSMLPLMQQLNGRCFVLFTSYYALDKAAEFLRDNVDLPLLVQGELPKHRLVEEFKAQGNAVLLGTTSFWEGVDVRGQALSAVMIDKLPFSSPGDPLYNARIKHYRSQGQNPFYAYQLPQAILALKQGVGRLIRDTSDYGIIVIADPRFMTRDYGANFLQSLPNMRYTRDPLRVEQFIDEYISA